MRSFADDRDRYRRQAPVCAAALALLVVLVPAAVRAQDAAETYNTLLGREEIVRNELAQAKKNAPLTETAAAAILRRLRVTVAAYDDLARRNAASGYSDNALWQAARLSADAYVQFGQAADRQAARRLFEALRSRFPSSSLVSRIPDELTRLARATPPPPPAPAVPAGPGVRTIAVSTAAGASQAFPSTLLEIRHESLPDLMRVTLLLEHERPFISQRLEDPERLYVDLQNTRVLYALKDADLRFDSGVVRRIRVDSREGERTRVVLDLERAGRTSVYPLYEPYRLVIDVARKGAPPQPSTAVASRGTPAETSPPAPSAPPAANPPDADPSTPPTPAAATIDGGYTLSRQLGLGATRIVIDPGHGGHDPGATVNGLTEAALVLDVALRLEALLRTHPGIDVVLTRRSDTFLALEERTALANRVQADLFLSVHANASTNSNARGIETYFLNFAGNPEAEAIAARENAGSTRTMRNLPEIVRAIALNDKIDESRDFATVMQASMYESLRAVNTGTRNLGVKQAPFQVLIGATMPSILAEISFITHEEEGELLKTEAYRQEVAEALLRGVVAYRERLKK